MSYVLREHTADIAVEATGPTLSAVFAAVAEGLTAAMCESIPGGGERFTFSVSAESSEALLFDYLDELIYERDVREVLPAEHNATVRRLTGVERVDAGRPQETRGDSAEEWIIDASARGIPFDTVDAREVKAVTYSEMDLSRTENGWHAYVVFDV